MKEIRPIDLNAIYESGFDAILLSREHYQLLLELVQSQNWIDDPDGIFIKVPSWSSTFKKSQAIEKIDQESEYNDWAMHNAPDNLLQSCRGLLESESIMGIWMEAYRAQMSFISLWNGAEDLDWHWDGPAQADFFFLIYLNRKTGWPEDGGGELIVGVRDVSSGYLKTNLSVVREAQRIRPASRTLVCVNNQNPRFVHKVLPLKNADERTVLMIGFNLIPTMSGEKSRQLPEM